jgi:phage protein D
MARFPRYAPEYQIQINGDVIPSALRASVMQVSYQDGIEGADRVEITIANEGLRWLDHPLLQVDNGFALSIGYAPDPLEEVFVGEITGVNVSFPNSGMPTVTVIAHDFLQRLTIGTKDRAFALSLPCIGKFPLPDPVVAALVGTTNLLIPVTDDLVGAALSFLILLIAYALDPLEAKNGIRIQQGQSDFDFLSNLAKDNGWEMYIDHTLTPRGYRLRFQLPVQEYSPSLTLKWGESLMDFTPKISTVGQVAGISTRIWVPSIKTEFVIVLSWDFDRAAFDLVVFPGKGSLEELLGKKAQGVLKIQANGPALAPKKLLSELLPRLNNRLTASGSTIGDPRIKAFRVINFEGLGEQFGGLYRVTSANHTIDSGGYRTQFEARKEVWFGSLPFGSIPVPKGASGLFRVQGQTIR